MQQSAPARAEAAIEELVRHALEGRFGARDIPDLPLLGKDSKRVAVRSDMRSPAVVLGPAALPAREGYEFFLVSEAEAQKEADRTGAFVHFIDVNGARIAGDTATIWLGVDFVFPRDKKLIKMCCCRGQAIFHREAGRWTFVKYADYPICG
jgi:hypothetical protein